MIKKESIDNKLDDEIYSKVNPLNWKFFVLGFLLLILGFLINFPIRKTIIGFTESKIGSFRPCPMTFERMELGQFLQWANFKGPILSGRCFGQSSGSLMRLDSLNLSFQMPSLNPPGPKLHLSLKKDKTNLNIYPTISYPKMRLEIKDSIIDGDIVQILTGDMFKLYGQIKVNSNLTLEKKNLSSGTISVVSKNLSIPPQNIMNFLVPYLNLGDLNIKGVVKTPNNLTFSSLKLGSKKSPIIANVSGSVKYNPQNPNGSTIDFKGKVKFSTEFVKKFGVLNLFTAGKTKDEKGFYSFSITGPLGRPKTRID